MLSFDRPLPTRKKALPTPGQLCFGGFGLFCLLLLLKNSEVAIEYMNRGLLLCVRTIIPSLFPFMVLSELIVSGGLSESLPRFLTRPLERLFGLPAIGCCAALLGMLCGFPVGAKCASLAYERGALTKKETERVLCFSNNPSSAFLISAVGVSLWGNHRFGTALYGVILASSVITGIFSNVFQKKKEKETLSPSFCTAPTTPLSGASLFSTAIRSATWSILLVSAYVVFFSTLMGSLELVLGGFSVGANVRAAIFCLLELSGGMSTAATLENAHFAALLSAFAAGWSGLSVHCQVLSVCDGKGLSFRGYFLSKLVQGAICACLFGVLLYFFPDLTVPAKGCGF